MSLAERSFSAFLNSNDDPGSLITDDETLTEDDILNANQYLPTPRQLVAHWS